MAASAVWFIVLLILCNGLNAEEKIMEENIMHASLAGSWYTGQPEKLQQELDQLFEQADVKPREDIVALISPHAGYAYSGQSAAMGVKTAGRVYKRIVVMGPSHRVPLPNLLSVSTATHFKTPLGRIPLDTDFAQKLLTQIMFKNVAQAFQGENSIELQIPLLQHQFKDAAIVPIAVGQLDRATVQAAADVLHDLLDNETLVVASCDFTHYGPNFGYVPFVEDIPANIKRLDMGAWAFVEQLDAQGFLDYQEKTGTTICGRMPIAILLSMLDSSTEALQIDYRTSGEITGDFNNSVSYLSAAFAGQWGSEHKTAVQAEENIALSATDRQWLLSLARQSITFALAQGRNPSCKDLELTAPAATLAQRAAFVTLKKGEHLRGCIGEIFPSQELYQSVINNAVNAALRDPRFPAVTAAELVGLHLEISALTPPQSVASYRDIRIGIDGMVLEKNGRSAVFLPQVAPEQGWDLDQTLTHLAMKAGLQPHGWREGAKFLTFQAEVFGEPL
ncbi:AmmeMemoRadiSam system protein B [Planctomycetota bacterium]